jgi:hypothetical protein
VDATLEGPTPWHIHGTGSFEIGFIFTITIQVQFDVTIGVDLAALLPLLSVLPLLAAALDDVGNWRAVLPAGSSLSVTLRELSTAGGALVLHPFGTLEVSQKVAPLNLALARVGAQRIDGGKTFHVDVVAAGNGDAQADPTREQFAPAQFLDLSDAEKLSRKSFERYDAGVRVGGGDQPAADYFIGLDVAYEVIYVPEKKKSVRFKPPGFLFDALVKAGAAAQSPLSFARRNPSGLGTSRVALVAEKFAVATTSDLSLHGDDLVFDSEAEAHAALQRTVAASPEMTSELQVVPFSQLSVPA